MTARIVLPFPSSAPLSSPVSTAGRLPPQASGTSSPAVPCPPPVAGVRSNQSKANDLAWLADSGIFLPGMRRDDGDASDDRVFRICETPLALDLPDEFEREPDLDAVWQREHEDLQRVASFGAGLLAVLVVVTIILSAIASGVGTGAVAAWAIR